MRLIDADALLDDFRKTIEECKKWEKDAKDSWTKTKAENAQQNFIEAVLRVKAAPTVDAVPVCRRKDWVSTNYGELVNLLRICPDYCKGCMNCPHEHDLGCRTTMMGEAADAIEELTGGRLVALDDRTALAIAAGARAIRENKRLVGTTYVYDVFGKNGGPYEISYHEACEILASIRDAYSPPEPSGGDK